MWIKCGFLRTRKSKYNLGPSSPALALKHLTYLPFTLLFLTLSWRQIKGLGPTVFHKKNICQRRHKYLVLRRDISCFAYNTTLILPKSFLKLISSTCSSFWLTTYLLCLVDAFFNRQSKYLWVQTELIFSPTCSLFRMRQTSYRGFSRKTKRSYPDPFISRSAI